MGGGAPQPHSARKLRCFTIVIVVSSDQQVHRTKRDMVDYARELRRNSTDAEYRLWALLREPGFADAKFRRQSPIGRYIVDFVSFRYKLIIEIDGGHHQHVDQSIYDSQRSNWLRSQGFRVIRFWNDEVLKETDVVLTAIFEALHGSSPPSAC